MALSLVTQLYIPYSIKNYNGVSLKDANGLYVMYMYKLNGYQQVVSFRNPAFSLDAGFKWSENEDCKTNWQGNKYCQLPVGIGDAEGLIWDSNINKWYTTPSMYERDLADRSKWIDVSDYVSKQGKLGTFSEMKEWQKIFKGTSKDDEGTTQDEKENLEGEKNPLASDEHKGMIQSYFAYLIPDFMRLGLGSSNNPEASKKLNRFLLICVVVGAVAFGRKRRVARRTSRRTAGRVSNRNYKKITA